MQEQQSTNPFTNYTLSITDAYQESVFGLIEAKKQPKRKTYKSITSLLEESFFLGATRFGENIIA